MSEGRHAYLLSTSSLPSLRDQFDQIANVGFLDVDAPTIGNAVARETMFIHGSLTGGGGTQFVSAKTRATTSRVVDASEAGQAAGGVTGSSLPHSPAAAAAAVAAASADCKPACGGGSAAGAAGAGGGGALYTVCDHAACSLAGGWRARENLCGAGDEEKFGRHCRACYLDEGEALEADRLLEAQARQAGQDGGQHVIMCDTMRPPQSTDCSLKCATKSDTVSTLKRWRKSYVILASALLRRAPLGVRYCCWAWFSAHLSQFFDVVGSAALRSSICRAAS